MGVRGLHRHRTATCALIPPPYTKRHTQAYAFFVTFCFPSAIHLRRHPQKSEEEQTRTFVRNGIASLRASHIRGEGRQGGRSAEGVLIVRRGRLPRLSRCPYPSPSRSRNSVRQGAPEQGGEGVLGVRRGHLRVATQYCAVYAREVTFLL